jgi:dolichol-phosphate mannosyltransferase
VVIPALNEAPGIAALVGAVGPLVDEVLVVDGRSEDGTAQRAAAAGARVLIQSGRGKGAAMRQAAEVARGDVLVFMDADGSHDPADIAALVGPIVAGDADHVSGSRLTGGSDELHGTFAEFFRLTGSAFITTVINLQLDVRISDSQCGYRAIRRDTFLSLDLHEDITTIEQEMVIKSLRRGHRLIEVPTHEAVRAHGTSKIYLTRVAPRYVYSLIKYLYF